MRAVDATARMASFLRATRAVATPVAALLIGAATPAQGPCHHRGSRPVPASVEASPFPLGCPAAPTWPYWHLFTPAHREPAVHTGFDPGSAEERKRVLVAYQCTGLLLVPVVPVHVRAMGYVIDQPEIACSPASLRL